MNVISYFDRARQTGADRAALVSGIGSHRRCVSYEELDAGVDRAVQRLRESDLCPGDKVLMAVPLSIETYIAMLATLKAGLVVMFVDPAHGRKTFTRCLRQYPPAAIIATRRIIRLCWLSAELRHIPRRFTVNGGRGKSVHLCDGVQCDIAQHLEPRAGADPALLTFTSGSTGEPKAVVRTHEFLGKQFAILDRVARLRTDDIDLVAMPMFVLFNLANGITSVIPACDAKRPGCVNAEILTAQLNAERATRMVASPALLERLADHCSDTHGQLPFIRRISTGGGPVSPTLPTRVQTIAPGASIVSVYGSTEAEPIASIDSRSVSAADLRRMCAGAGLLAGTPVDGCEVRIIQYRPGPVRAPGSARSFESAALASGCIGEIIVSGEHVLKGYVDVSRDAETKLDIDGTWWHRTGDAGYFDDRGRLWLVGRCSAVIDDARGIIYPFQVEYAVANIEGIRRAALIADRGDRVLAIETRSRRDAVDHPTVAKQIPDVVIDRIVPLKRIPLDRRHDAKIDYPALRKLLGAGSL